jgi:hypothetical protein
LSHGWRSAALALAIVAAAGCGGDSDRATLAAVDARDGERPQADGLTLDAPEGAVATVWVRRGAEVRVRTAPGGGRLADVVRRRTEWGSPTVFAVFDHRPGWAGVSSPALPNGKLGWVRLDPRELKSGWTGTSILVDLSERRAILREDGERARSFAVTVGAPGSETPTGRFAVTDTFRGDLAPAYGCCALALSATQPNLPSGWLGGNRIAIHGTAGPIGVAASNGCVRAADRDVSALVERVPLGAEVVIRR